MPFYITGANGLWIFLLITILLGGSAAFISGKSVAETWRPFWQLPLYIFLLTVIVRFLHFALFEEVLLSARNFVVDYMVVFGFSVLGYRLARARQMKTQYDPLKR